ncbi:MAG: zinc ribbon domain-containing protein [Clostridiaceae bacterium]|nr:zinc ribbon domain-containing protein [Clostridiaceae bacterium]
MNAQFCRHCGQPLEPGVSFCVSCGNPVSQPAAPGPPVARPTAPVRARRKPSWIPIVIGVLLLIMGIRIPLALALGEETTGTVKSVEQRINSTSSKLDHNYDIHYTFRTRDGKTGSGTTSMNRVYNVTRLPAEGSSIGVTYLPGLPFVNVPSDQKNMGWSTLIFIALSALLLVAGIRGTASVTRVRR